MGAGTAFRQNGKNSHGRDKSLGVPEKSQDFMGRGGAAE